MKFVNKDKKILLKPGTVLKTMEKLYPGFGKLESNLKLSAESKLIFLNENNFSYRFLYNNKIIWFEDIWFNKNFFYAFSVVE